MKRISTLVDQICRCQSIERMNSLSIEAVGYAGMESEAGTLANCLMKAIETWGSHLDEVKRGLDVIEKCLKEGGNPFMTAMRPMTVRIRMIPMLTFESRNSAFRNDTHAKAFRIYKILTGRTVEIRRSVFDTEIGGNSTRSDSQDSGQTLSSSYVSSPGLSVPRDRRGKSSRLRVGSMFVPELEMGTDAGKLVTSSSNNVFLVDLGGRKTGCETPVVQTPPPMAPQDHAEALRRLFSDIGDEIPDPFDRVDVQELSLEFRPIATV